MRTRPRFPSTAVPLGVLLSVLLSSSARAQQPVAYVVSFPAPEHHYAQVEVTFTAVSQSTLELRMSRSSPGRYALHEFAKNVLDVQAVDGQGRPLDTTRPNPYQWDVTGHDGTVRVTYKVYGDRVDGTYLAVDPTHAHMNMPATLMWARGMEDRPARLAFEPPAGSSWTAATQLFPTDDEWVFTAPNLQYLLDSPVELSAHTTRAFEVANADGRTFEIRVAIHHDASDKEVDEYVAAAKKIVAEQGAIFGEYPEFDTGSYTFLADYVPWGGGDGMEHRNSTVVAARVSLRTPGTVQRVLGTVSHEFFHAWNVERIRPASLEPFDFEEANMSGELWLAEGFTQYYGSLAMIRAGLVPMSQGGANFAHAANAVINGGGRRFRSPVEMSRMAPFVDAARSVDPTNFSRTFISYYTYGAAVALGLDLSLRERSNGKITLDDYMRALWRAHGKPGGAQPGLVARPYTIDDLRAQLALVSGDRAFADEFFDRYIQGRDVLDYARLFLRAGYLFRRSNPGTPWLGVSRVDKDGTIDGLVPWGSPLFEAGLDEGDAILALGGKAVGDGAGLAAALKNRKPGERVEVAFRRRGGATGTTTLVLEEDPTMEATPVEAGGGTLSIDQKNFREAWLGSRVAEGRKSGL